MESTGPSTTTVWVIRVFEAVLGLGICAVSALACLQVVSRYVFSNGLPWVEEVSIGIMIAMVWLSATPIWMARSHLALTLLHEYLPHRARRWLDLAIHLLLTAFALAVAWASQSTYPAIAILELSATELPMAFYYYPVTAGALCLALAGVHGAWNTLAGGRPS